MEEKKQPILSESYYKGLEQQKNELNKQAQMLLAQEGQGGEPVEQAPPKKKTKQDHIEDAIKRGVQVYHWIKIPEDHLETLKMKKLRERENGETMTIIDLKIL